MMTTVALPEVMDKTSLPPLAEAMTQAIAAGAGLRLEGSQAGRIGLSAVQLLACAARTARADGCAFELANPSAELVAAAALAGLEEQLGFHGQTGAAA